MPPPPCTRCCSLWVSDAFSAERGDLQAVFQGKVTLHIAGDLGVLWPVLCPSFPSWHGAPRAPSSRPTWTPPDSVSRSRSRVGEPHCAGCMVGSDAPPPAQHGQSAAQQKAPCGQEHCGPPGSLFLQCFPRGRGPAHSLYHKSDVRKVGEGGKARRTSLIHMHEVAFSVAWQPEEKGGCQEPRPYRSPSPTPG